MSGKVVPGCFVSVYVWLDRVAPVVLFVAVTVMVPEKVIEFDGESAEIDPTVFTRMPVNVVELLTVTEIGVTAVGICSVLVCGPLVPVTLTV